VLSNEIWKPITDYPYEISSLGRVRNKQGKILKTYIQNSGYEQIKFRGVHKQIHRLVAEAFIPNPMCKTLVNHIDGNKLNNTVDNLEWVTNSENIIHARRTGLNPYNKPTSGKKCSVRKNASEKQSDYYGVLWDKSRQKWIGYVTWDKVKYLHKRFDTEELAAQARDDIVKQFNIPLPLNFI